MAFGFKKKDPDVESKSKSDDKREGKKSFFNTRRRKKTLVSQIKLSQSVPSTIIDVVNGSNDFINSENDFARIQHIRLDGHDYIPIFAIDERGLNSIQIQTPANKEIFGQLSTGLKTSSGSSGFLPVATKDSLADEENPFFGIIPMHDAFQVLEDFEIFNHSDEGWAVALLSIENDMLDLVLCESRYSLSQWISFLNGQCDFIVDDDRVLLSEEIPVNSDVFALSEEEKQIPKAQETSSNESNLFSIDAFDNLEEDESSNNSKHEEETDSGFLSVEDVLNGTPSDGGDSTFDFDSEPPKTEVYASSLAGKGDPEDIYGKQVVDEHLANLGSNQTVESEIPSFEQVTEDDLNAEKITLESQVTTMNDLKISISDQDFVRSCLEPLTVSKFPMLDTSNDPTGRIAQENTLRAECNEVLESMMNSEKANLRQWFEMNRAGLLNSLRSENLNKGKQTKKLFDSANELREELSNGTVVRTKAESQISDRLDQLDLEHDESFRKARDAAIAEVERIFNERKKQVRKEKDDLIAQQELSVKQELTSQIANINKTIQDISQAAASAGYEKIIQQASIRYGVAQQTLDTEYQALMDRIAYFTRTSRQDENKRVSDQAAIAKHDTTISQLNNELESIRRSHDDFIKKQRETHEREMTELRESLKSRYESDIEEIQKQLMASREEVAKFEDRANSRLETRESELQSKINELRDENIYNSEKYEKSLKATQRTAWVVGIVVAVCLAVVGYLGGAALTDKKTTTVPSVETNTNANTNANGGNNPQVFYIDGTNKVAQPGINSNSESESKTDDSAKSEKTDKAEKTTPSSTTESSSK